jgi:hypothetical protein
MEKMSQDRELLHRLVEAATRVGRAARSAMLAARAA